MEEKLDYLVDTCVFIDYLRGNPNVYDILTKYENINLSMSSITMMELLIGAFNKKEAIYIQNAFRNINVIHISENISKLALEYVAAYSKSHNLQIPDALIAATSVEMNMRLITSNVSDFHYIPDIELHQFFLL